ncbi:MAG: M81 family metallopeptidase [Candidatus Bathyarchaeia archaeon]
MRILVGGIRHETNTFSTLHTDIEDFQVKRGSEILSEEPWRDFRGIEWAPTLLAYAFPHGLVSRRAYLSLKNELISRIEASPPADGILLDLHGAMEVEGIGSGEVDLVKNIREVASEDMPIAVSLDLHGNISRELAEKTDVITGFRTAPHTDSTQTKTRALMHLIECIKKGLKSRNVIIKVPIVLPGEFAVTHMEPAKTLYSRLYEIERVNGIMDASLFIGCAWSDTPNTSLSIIVVARGKEHCEKARDMARKLAREVWARRREFAPEVTPLPVDEAIDAAMRSKDEPVIISDTGDNVTAGGAGDTVILLEKLLQARAIDASMDAIVDPEAVSKLSQAEVGEKVSLELGGKLDSINSHPISVEGLVTHVDYPNLAVLRIDGVEVIVTSKRRLLTTLKEFEEIGVNPLKKKVIVVKAGYLFSDLRHIAKKSIWALTPGFTSLEIEKLPYRRIKRPIYPLDKEFEYYEF